MKTFKILNRTVSFDDGIIDYINIVQQGQSYITDFDIRYRNIPQKQINTMEDFGLYVNELADYVPKEYIKISEELVNIYIKYNIYDMSPALIQTNYARFLSKHVERMKPIINEIATFVAQVKQGVTGIQAKWKQYVDEAVPGHYFNVYSPYYSDILLNDYFNHKEEKRVERKRERLYNQNASKTVNEYMTQVLELCYSYIDKIQQVIYEDTIEMVDGMYKNCAMDLVAKGKISSFSQYTDSLKSNAILDNINRIADKAVAEEQIVNLLQIDPLNPSVHLKALDYITNNDITEYAEFIKLFKLENMIFYIYTEDSSKGGNGNKDLNNKCLNILKLVKDSLNMGIISKENASFSYTDDVFIETVAATKIYFECLKNIFGEDNKIINEKEQKMFMTAIKEASKGTNLTYDGSIMHLDYDHLCEFWKKARNQHNSTIKRQEIKQEVSNSFTDWIRNHIKSIIIFIIIIAIFHFATKDSNNKKTNSSSTTSAIQNTQVIEDKKEDTYYTTPNYNSDSTISEDDLFNYKQNSEYIPGKANPFGN